MEKKAIKELREFELKHKIISFIGITILTILITRLILLFKDPNIIIKGFELHHFYYGLCLLIITTIFMLFGKKHYLAYLTTSAIAIGLILDELIFIMGKIRGEIKYINTIPSTLVFVIILSLIIIATFYISKNQKK